MVKIQILLVPLGVVVGDLDLEISMMTRGKFDKVSIHDSPNSFVKTLDSILFFRDLLHALIKTSW